VGIAVKKGDFLFIFLNGISAITVRANISIRPATWWGRVFGTLKHLLGQADPFNVNVDLVSTTDRTMALLGVEIQVDGEVDAGGFVVLVGPVPDSPGQVYASAALTRSGAAGAFCTLMGGYIWLGGTSGYPGGKYMGPLEGDGRLVASALAQPAAGADYADVTTPASTRTLLKNWRGQLTTAVAVANREVANQYQDATGVYGGVVASENQVASLVIDYLASTGGLVTAGVSNALAGGVVGIGLADLKVLEGTGFRWKTFNLQPADQWSLGRMVIEEWISP